MGGRDVPGDAPLAAKCEGGAGISERIAADGEANVAADVKRVGEVLVVVRGFDKQLVAVFELNAKYSGGDAGLDPTRAVGDVVDAGFPGELPYRSEIRRSWTEPG